MLKKLCKYNPPKYLDHQKVFPIYVFYQFSIDSNSKKYSEIKFALKKNIECPYIDKIYLLNKRSYTNEEYGINSIEREKIHEIIIGKRISFEDFFKYAMYSNGYVVLCNPDIYFDNTLINIFTTVLSTSRSVFCNLCMVEERKIWPRSDSQGAWLFHTNNLPKSIQKYNVCLDVPGCDNILIHKLSQDKFIIYNEPLRIRINHTQKTYIVDNSQPKNTIINKCIYVYPYLSYELKPNYKELKSDTLFNIIQQRTFLITSACKYPTQLALKHMYSYNTKHELKLVESCGINTINKNDVKTYSTLYADALIHSDCFYIHKKLENNTIFEMLNKPYINSALFDKDMFLTLIKYLNSKKIVVVVDNSFPVQTNRKASIINVDKFVKYNHWFFIYKIINLFLEKQTYDIVICLTSKYGGISNLWCHTAMKHGKGAMNIPYLNTLNLYQYID